MLEGREQIFYEDSCIAFTLFEFQMGFIGL